MQSQRRVYFAAGGVGGGGGGAENVWAGDGVLAVWASPERGRVFLAVRAGVCLLHCLLLFGGRGGGAFLFLLFGRAACCFLFTVGAGTGVYSLTGLPGLALGGPITEHTKQQNSNKNMASPV